MKSEIERPWEGATDYAVYQFDTLTVHMPVGFLKSAFFAATLHGSEGVAFLHTLSMPEAEYVL